MSHPILPLLWGLSLGCSYFHDMSSSILQGNDNKDTNGGFAILRVLIIPGWITSGVAVLMLTGWRDYSMATKMVQ